MDGHVASNIPFWRMVFDQGAVTKGIANASYKGNGTEEDPFIVIWLPDDPRDPVKFKDTLKFSVVFLASMGSLAIAMGSSTYSGGLESIISDFQCSREVAILGISLFVLGFAIGPLLWAPLSEAYGRRKVLSLSLISFTVFTAGTAGAQNIWTLIILRFFAGSLGSAPMAVSGGLISDTFSAIDRGLYSSLYAATAFMGPALGPIVGGFIAEAGGWRWCQGFQAIFCAALWLLQTLFLPETYGPVLLRERAKTLSKLTGKVYRTQRDVEQHAVPTATRIKTTLFRPFILLFGEPIVLLLSVYIAIIYGTLYLLFDAYPIVFQDVRGWSPGIGGLAFLGVLVGILGSIFYSVSVFFSYKRKTLVSSGPLPPEARLPSTFIGSVLLPVGLFWFAWTNGPSIHWMASIAAGVPFGFGMVTVYMPVLNYLMDTYTIYAASVLAGNCLLRSLFGCIFPLFTTYMYRNLGIHWASCIPAFLSLLCMPMPFLFYKYGAQIRKGSQYAAEAEAYRLSLLAPKFEERQLKFREEEKINKL
ncbi:MFS general substrate transporter [Penicillium longicatenatum]|uniref:MFS general substrate transporter n=1 Tax=Penicillium longicatenatum TaxID=1561947 RepID=UPI0025465D70|nr:MFS general substrate transporter [Penicillium longicatenatum]KAJ5631144.1 MFS general substrate transporter [Penicillium longicatenatum]